MACINPINNSGVVKSVTAYNTLLSESPSTGAEGGVGKGRKEVWVDEGVPVGGGGGGG